jgi:hypothetical protein
LGMCTPLLPLLHAEFPCWLATAAAADNMSVDCRR